MDVQEIEITINKNGQVEVHVRGVKGKACLDLTQELEKILGGEVILREMTPEADEVVFNPLDNQLNIGGK